MQNGVAAQSGGLLCLVFLRHGSMSTGSGRGRLLRMTLIQRINIALGRVPSWLVYIVSVFPPVWLFWLGTTGGLGVEPIKELEHKLGELALQLMILTLAVRPIYDWIGINLMKHRRAIGVVTFFYVFLHLLVWLVLDVGILSEIWADIVKRPYITVGMGAFALMLPLTITSNNFSLRKLGPQKWKRLHKLSYLVAFLGALHFVMLARGFQLEPLIYMGIVLILLATRLRLPWKSAVA